MPVGPNGDPQSNNGLPNAPHATRPARYPPAPPATAPLLTRTHAHLPMVTLTLRVRVSQDHTCTRPSYTINIPLYNTTNYGYGSQLSLDTQLATHGFPACLLEAGRVWGIRVVACGEDDVQRWLQQLESSDVDCMASSNLVGQYNNIVGDSARHWTWWLKNVWFWWGIRMAEINEAQDRGGMMRDSEDWAVGVDLYCS